MAGVRRGREKGFCSAAKDVSPTRRIESSRRLDFQRPCTALRGKASSTVLDGRESLFWRADIRALWLKKTVARITYVASVSVRFRTKERGSRVKDRAKNGVSKRAGRGGEERKETLADKPRDF